MSFGYILNDIGASVDKASQLGGRLATVDSINLKTAGQTPLYTVPAGKSLVVTSLILRTTNVSGFLTPATVRVGITPNFDGFIAATALTNVDTVGEAVNLASVSTLIYKVFVAGDVVNLDVTIGATGTTVTGSVDLIGYLL